MPMSFPGTTIEVSVLKKDSSKTLFDGIFAAGGITLSQVCVMTGLEPYMIQNWVKRGFLSSPNRRMYTREQFARIIIINMLRETLQIDRICGLIETIRGDINDPEDDLIGDEELYHCYVNMLAEQKALITDEVTIDRAAKAASLGQAERIPNGRQTLTQLLKIMLYAHLSAQLRDKAVQLLGTLE